MLVSALVWTFRSELRARLADLKTLEGPGIRADFHRRIERIERVASVVPVRALTAAGWLSAERASLVDELLKVHGNSAFLAAFTSLEAILRDVAERSGLNLPRLTPLRRIVSELGKRELISPDVAGVLAELVAMRNSVIHDDLKDLPNDDARRLVEMVGWAAGQVGAKG